jgi:peptidoglycan/LPS O-acetylase OafA/YrhL
VPVPAGRILSYRQIVRWDEDVILQAWFDRTSTVYQCSGRSLLKRLSPRMPVSSRGTEKYRPDIDGLRAIAVVAVVAFHSFPNFFKGGFVGVDIFFVISGFLISGIIIDALERDRFSYLDFYIRRIRRIFPALIVVVASTLIVGWYVLLPDEFQRFGKHLAAGAGFAANFVLWEESGYFDVASDTKPFLHLWSLAIEEQFYILWPLILGLVWRRWRGLLLATLSIRPQRARKAARNEPDRGVDGRLG